MLSIQPFVFNTFQVNTYILYDETGDCIILDPGCQSRQDFVQIESYLSDKKLKPVFILQTHGHVDHIMGSRGLKNRFNLPILAHTDDDILISNAEIQALFFGIHIDKPYLPDRYIVDNEIITFGNTRLKVLHVPGHSPGSLAFYSEADQTVLTGDVLFRNSIGRTDLPGGNHTTLIESIQQKLLVLPEKTKVYPGHSMPTTIKDEKESNPYL